jgi:polysaccharide biosynthesis transport protein
MAVSLTLSKKYTGSASVVIDFKPDPISAAFYGGAPPPALMATQVDIIKSDRIGQRVVRNLKLAETPGVKKQWQDATDGQGSLEAWLVELIERNLEVLPSRESSVITVTYKAADPKFAAAMANAVVQAYVETSLELRVDPARQYAGFFDVRAKDARETLEKAQSHLSAFQKQAGIVATDERLDVETARLNELSTQLVALQAISAESRSRQTQATSNQSDRLQEVLLNPVVGGLHQPQRSAAAGADLAPRRRPPAGDGNTRQPGRAAQPARRGDAARHQRRRRRQHHQPGSRGAGALAARSAARQGVANEGGARRRCGDPA